MPCVLGVRTLLMRAIPQAVAEFGVHSQGMRQGGFEGTPILPERIVGARKAHLLGDSCVAAPALENRRKIPGKIICQEEARVGLCGGGGMDHERSLTPRMYEVEVGGRTSIGTVPDSAWP